MQLTKSEIIKIITAIKIQCPDALPIKDESESDFLVDMWFDCFKEYPKEVVWAAVRNALKNTVYQKQNWLGAISQEIDKMQVAYEKPKEELWVELTSVLHNVSSNVYAYKYTFREQNGKTQGENAYERNKEIFNKLSPELKEYCRSLNGLEEIADYTEEQLSYERGRFMREMPILRERARTRQTTPNNIAGLIQGVSNKLRLESGERKDNEKLF